MRERSDITVRWATMRRAVAGLIIAALFVSGCGKNDPVTNPPDEIVVNTAIVESVEVAELTQSVGTVEAVREAALSARLMGVIEEIRVSEGDRVKAGQTLVVIDAADIRAKKAEAEQAKAEGVAALDEARAALENADINMARMDALYKEQAVTKKELDDMTTHRRMAKARLAQAEARIGQADAGIRQADAMLGYAVIASPVNGVVVAKNAHAGEMAAPGMLLLKVVDDADLRLSASLSEGDAGSISPGDEAMVKVDAIGGAWITGRVSQVVPSADPATRTFMVKVALPRIPKLLPGMFGRAYFNTGVRCAVIVPDASLVEREGVTGVYVVGEDGLIRFQAVTTAKLATGGTEALSGLSGVERVVTGGQTGLTDGMRAIYDAQAADVPVAVTPVAVTAD